uniref:Putative pyruvate dehydrogenase phosphatase isoenzyme 2 n=1 Tax=Labrus bergylta TaxID=56723 RepID=A0A3Q3EZR5_9LABR
MFVQYTHLEASPSSQPRSTHNRYFSSRGAFRADQLGSRLEDSLGNGSLSGRRLSTRQDLDFHLNQVQINSILRLNEQAVSVPEFDGRGLSTVRKFESNQLAANTPNEDRRSAATCLQVSFFPSTYTTTSISQLFAPRQTRSPILQWYKHHSDFNYRESASLYIDHLRVFWQELLDSEDHGEGMSLPDALDHVNFMHFLCCICWLHCSVAHIGTEGIHVANTGDCRVVLGVQEEDGSWSLHPSSEKDTVITDDRLLGVLMPLRAFGDVRFKWSHELQQSVLAGLESRVDLDSLNLYQYTPPNYLTPPIWTCEEAVRLVGEHLSGIHLQVCV